MALDTNKNSYTVIFAIVMVIVVGAALAGVSNGLKPLVEANQRAEKQQNILYTIGVNENQGDSDVRFISPDIVEDKFKELIKAQYYLQGGELVEDNEAYLISLPQEENKAKKDKNYEPKLPLIVAEKDGEDVYIMPLLGSGLWDAIWGFIAIDKDMVIQGVYFGHEGETPGLGGEISQRYFMDPFAGEHLLDENGNFKGVEVAKGNNDPTNARKEDHKVDALAGSTITGNGVTGMIKKLRAYVPYFKTLNE